MLCEVLNTAERMAALQVHQRYLNLRLKKEGDNTSLLQELRKTEELIRETKEILDNPRGHWVEVKHSRKVEVGSVGKVVYASKERNHVRVEFGNSERVSCALSNVEVIDWSPLPFYIPRGGERVFNIITGDYVTVIEWGDTGVVVYGYNGKRIQLSRDSISRDSV